MASKPDSKEFSRQHESLSFAAKTIFFIEALRQKYISLISAVQPIPYISEKLFKIDKVFVEGGYKFLDKKGSTSGESWQDLNSYKDIRTDPRISSKRRIIIGEPGFGKSMFTLQMAHDWCNSLEIADVEHAEVLILLRLRQLEGVDTVSKAIRRFLLPSNSPLGEDEIEEILLTRPSVVMVLDGFDEYPEQENDENSFVQNIISGEMFEEFEVILTSRYLPSGYAEESKHIILKGFDEKARDEYIHKTVVGNDIAAAKNIKRKLLENPVLSDFCEVPLIFVMFAHISFERNEMDELQTVTRFFRCMIKCFHSHMENKMKDKGVQKYYFPQEAHKYLDKVAFEGLRKKKRKTVWSKQQICGEVGGDFYEHYKRTGILVEEEVQSQTKGQTEIQVFFYHRMFCEWYAAHHLARLAERNSFEDLSDLLKHTNVFDLHYLYRFACGINPTSAKEIIKYVKGKSGTEQLVLLCILEQHGTIETIFNDMEDMFSGVIEFRKNDNIVLQKSTIQLLEIASKHSIPIYCVWLRNTFRTAGDKSSTSIDLKSRCRIPVLSSVRKLGIKEEGRDITAEVPGIFKFASECKALTTLVENGDMGFKVELQRKATEYVAIIFESCLVLEPVKSECLGLLRSRNIQVFLDDKILDLECGLWQRTSRREY